MHKGSQYCSELESDSVGACPGSLQACVGLKGISCCIYEPLCCVRMQASRYHVRTYMKQQLHCVISELVKPACLFASGLAVSYATSPLPPSFCYGSCGIPQCTPAL